MSDEKPEGWHWSVKPWNSRLGYELTVEYLAPRPEGEGASWIQMMSAQTFACLGRRSGAIRKGERIVARRKRNAARRARLGVSSYDG